MKDLRIINDVEVEKYLDMKKAIDLVDSILCKLQNDLFVSPARFNVGNDNGNLVFTVGGDKSDGIIGFRVYETFGISDSEQLVVCYNAKTGSLKGIVLGSLLGAMRTGAIGGVAIRYLSRIDSESLGLIGTGLQARTQLLAACKERKLKVVKVYSRNEKNRDEFSKKMSEALGIKCIAVESSNQAVENSDIVIAATNSEKPVFNSEYLKKGVHVNTVGPKFKNRHELDISVAQESDLIYTDSMEQINSYSMHHFLNEHESFNRIQSLKTIAGLSKFQRGKGNTLFLSAGLSGTEPALANLVFDSIK